MMTPVRVVLVEDNVELAEEVAFHLKSDGFACHSVHNAAALTARLAQESCDVLVLDLGLPDADGLDVALALADRPGLRIVMLTARTGRQERIAGLNAGADVYLSKPVDLEELSAVIRSAARRMPGGQAGHVLDRQKQILHLDGGKSLRLTTLEYNLLARLIAAPDRTASRDDLEAFLWRGAPTLSTAKRLDILIHRLRSKLIDNLPPGSKPITTRWGQGYVLAIDMALSH